MHNAPYRNAGPLWHYSSWNILPWSYNKIYIFLNPVATARSFCSVALLQCPFCIILCFDTVQSCRWIQQSQFFNFSHCCCCSFRSCWMFCCCNWEIVTELNAWPWQWRHFNASEYQSTADTAWLRNKICLEYLIVSQIGCLWNIWNNVEYTPVMRSKRLK